MPQAFVALDAHPGVLGPLGVQREEERLAGTEVRLPLAAVVLQVALEPPGRTVGAEYLEQI